MEWLIDYIKELNSFCLFLNSLRPLNNAYQADKGLLSIEKAYADNCQSGVGSISEAEQRVAGDTSRTEQSGFGNISEAEQNSSRIRAVKPNSAYEKSGKQFSFYNTLPIKSNMIYEPINILEYDFVYHIDKNKRLLNYSNDFSQPKKHSITKTPSIISYKTNNSLFREINDNNLLLNKAAMIDNNLLLSKGITIDNQLLFGENKPADNALLFGKAETADLSFSNNDNSLIDIRTINNENTLSKESKRTYYNSYIGKDLLNDKIVSEYAAAAGNNTENDKNSKDGYKSGYKDNDISIDKSTYISTDVYADINEDKSNNKGFETGGIKSSADIRADDIVNAVTQYLAREIDSGI